MRKINLFTFSVGLLYFLVSLYLAVFYNEERIAFGDAAYQLFTILRTNDFAIQVMRFGSSITMIFPLLASKFGFSLEKVVLIYSLSFELIALMVFLALIFYYRNLRLAISLLLLKTLAVSHTFFWVQSELLQGLVFLVLFLAWLKDKYIDSFNPIKHVVFLLLVLTLVFFHPLIIFPFIFTILYFILFNNDGYDKKTSWTAVLLFVSITVLKNLLLKNSYDSGAMSGLNNFKTFFPNFIFTPSNIQFVKYCITDYYFIPLISFSILITLFFLKKYMLLILSTLFLAIYFLIVQISNYNWESIPFRIESFYMPLVLMLSILFVFELFKFKKGQVIILLCTIFSILAFNLRVYKTSDIYSNQLNWNKDFIKNNLNQKLVINEKELNNRHLVLPWAFPYQSWILSTLYHQKTALYCVADDPHSFDWTLWKTNGMLTKWGIFEFSDFNSKYFIFPDDTTGYKHFSE